jgi:hypothetical protein
MKFSGKFKGCVRETVVNSKGVAESEYKAEIKIKNVNCSNKTAYLINVVDSTGKSDNLAYMEDFTEKPVLRSIDESGNGVTSTYYEDKYLIHQLSTVKTDCKGNKEWIVKYYKMKQC